MHNHQFVIDEVMKSRTTSLLETFALGVASATVVSLIAFGAPPPARADSPDTPVEALTCQDPPCGILNPCTCQSAGTCGPLQGDCLACDWTFVCNETDPNTGACIDGYCAP
jgi:hypothetical protein